MHSRRAEWMSLKPVINPSFLVISLLPKLRRS